jgi:small-conductance mechanosensitive channel
MEKRNFTQFTKCAFGILIISIFILPITVSSQVYDPHIGDDDVYEKSAEVDNSVYFNWTVFRNSTLSYVVRVTAKGFESWDQQLFPSYFVLDENNPYEIVCLKATVPEFPEVKSREASVTFTFRTLNGTDTITFTKQAFILVENAMSEEEENAILGVFENPLPPPLHTPLGAFILNVILWVVIAFALYYFIKIILIGFAKKTKTPLDDKLIQIVRWPFLFIITLYGAVQSIYKIIAAPGIQFSISRISVLIFFILGIYIIYRVFNEILESYTEKKGGDTSMFGAVIRPVLRKIGATIIIIGGFIYALSSIGIEVTALLAGAGVIGLVIAFAAQDTLSNFFSGIHLLIDRPFKIGDVISLEPEQYCRVENVGMRSTRLYSIFDHELIIMPNNMVANQKIINLVKPDVKIRKKFKISVAYGTDLEKVMNIFFTTAGKHPNVVKEKGFEPLVRFTEFGDSGLEFTVILWIDEVMNQWKVVHDLRLEIDALFRKENITIPFPQRTVWLNQINHLQPEDKKKNDKNKNKEI